MKKLVLTMVALVAMATSSFAQFSASDLQMIEKVVNDYCSSYSMPSVTYSVPSTVNYNTTTVSGYTRSNGTYVQSHVRTMPNNTNWDNFSTIGNSNPFTGSTSRGGQYYYNSNGHKTYVPKRNLW